jgi:CitMHS family citrate-Mg2+:H+ or citrate-Ca2+:H+ symporter
MLLTIFSWSMIVVFLLLVMTKKMQPFTALVLVPLVFTLAGAILGLFDEKVAESLSMAATSLSMWDRVSIIGSWTVTGLTKTSNTALMLLFAILFFAIMLNAGLFDPVTTFIIRLAKGDPVKVLVGTAAAAAMVSLNGDGTTTTLICCTAFIPIYKRLNLKMMNLGVLVILMNTIMNLLPWGGPTARVISVLGTVSEQAILNTLIPSMAVAVIYMLGVAYYLGLKERKRVGIQNLSSSDIASLTAAASPEEEALKRPKRILVNAVLTVSAVVMLVFGTFPSVFIFLVSTALALMVNYREISDQKSRIQDNAGDALQVVILVIGAGIFMGLFTSSGMSDALAASMINLIPPQLGRFWGLVTAVVSAPGTFFLSNDAFYYGVLPIFAEAGYQYGFSALEIGTASLLGQAFHLLSPLVAFIYLLLRLTGLDMGEWQRESAKWAIGVFVIFIGVAVVTGNVPLLR